MRGDFSILLPRPETEYSRKRVATRPDKSSEKERKVLAVCPRAKQLSTAGPVINFICYPSAKFRLGAHGDSLRFSVTANR